MTIALEGERATISVEAQTYDHRHGGGIMTVATEEES